MGACAIIYKLGRKQVRFFKSFQWKTGRGCVYDNGYDGRKPAADSVPLLSADAGFGGFPAVLRDGGQHRRRQVLARPGHCGQRGCGGRRVGAGHAGVYGHRHRREHRLLGADLAAFRRQELQKHAHGGAHLGHCGADGFAAADGRRADFCPAAARAARHAAGDYGGQPCLPEHIYRLAVLFIPV